MRAPTAKLVVLIGSVTFLVLLIGTAFAAPAVPQTPAALTPWAYLPIVAYNNGSWWPTSRMSRVRYNHTATLLPSGDVLVTGGGKTDWKEPASASAEIFHPGTDTWSPAASMSVARSGHTATLLTSGKVLVAGGESVDFIYRFYDLASAELYDPATDSWSPAASMSVARYGPTATLLPSGDVLVVGGLSNHSSLASAELYDPATDSWSPAASMSVARSGHTATLLLSGEVLVAGGGTSGYPAVLLDSAELYDPARDSWSPPGSISMSVARIGHTATLLASGMVLVAGGQDSTGSYLASAELYNSATSFWSPAASMSVGRGSHTATLLLSGKVLVAGGSSTSSYQGSAELFDPEANSWARVGSANYCALPGSTATLLSSGMVLVAGGYAGLGGVDSACLYQP